MWLMFAVLALPLVEIALFVVVGGSIGLWATLAWVVVSAVLGVFILKRVARMGAISFDRDVRALRDPVFPIAGRAISIIAAGLLILPGFFTDAVGLLLLLPPVQSLLANLFASRLRQSGAVHQASMTIEGDWAEVPPARNDDETQTDSSHPPSGWTRH